MSTTRTDKPPRANAAERLTTVVVFPTPPFWFATTRIRASAGEGKRKSRPVSRETLGQPSRSTTCTARGQPRVGATSTLVTGPTPTSDEGSLFITLPCSWCFPSIRYRDPLSRSVRRAARSQIRDPDHVGRFGTRIGPCGHELRSQPMPGKHLCSLVDLGRDVPTFQGKDHPA